jgi:hypothetical protein
MDRIVPKLGIDLNALKLGMTAMPLNLGLDPILHSVRVLHPVRKALPKGTYREFVLKPRLEFYFHITFSPVESFFFFEILDSCLVISQFLSSLLI